MFPGSVVPPDPLTKPRGGTPDQLKRFLKFGDFGELTEATFVGLWGCTTKPACMYGKGSHDPACRILVGKLSELSQCLIIVRHGTDGLEGPASNGGPSVTPSVDAISLIVVPVRLISFVATSASIVMTIQSLAAVSLSKQSGYRYGYKGIGIVGQDIERERDL